MSKHEHSCAHGHHDHSHVPETFDRAFLIAIVANGLFVIFQIIFAYMSNSTSLLADAFHNLGDVLGLVLAWAATGLMKRAPTQKATYGMKKMSIVSALANGLLLVFTCGIIAAEAIAKFLTPSEVQALWVIVVAGVGIVINSLTALLFMRGAHDLNIKAAYLHLLYDALISVGVVVSAALLYWTGWQWIDPLVGLLIALIMLKGTWSLFRRSFRLILDGVPDTISWTAVSEFLLKKPGVVDFHDLHIWALSTQENALSVHLVMPELTLSDQERSEWVKQLKHDFGIQHVTIQVEKTIMDCSDACHTPKFL